MTPGERTPEEREQARLEREARRAGKAAPKPPKAPPVARPQKPPPFEPPAPAEPQPTERRPRVRMPSAADRTAKTRELLQRRREKDSVAGNGSRTRRRLLPLAAAGILLATVVWLLLSLFQPFTGDGESEVRVTIPRGSGVGDIADLLEDEGGDLQRVLLRGEGHGVRTAR